MSISSLMTATVPHNPHLSHQRYNHTPTLASYNHSLSNGGSRLASSHTLPQPHLSSSKSSSFNSSRQLPPLGTMPPSTSASQKPYPPRGRNPDWEEFYKNGPPKEIIVIDDDDDDEEPAPPPAARRKVSTRRQPSPQARAGAQPQAKKRRTAYDSARDYHTSYPARTFSPVGSSSNDSSDRTRSLQNTTAPTSLGSHTSHGSTGAYIEDVGVGQKRKRITRTQIAADKKRQEANAVDAYVPPPHPPYKSKDVHVPTLRDVSLKSQYALELPLILLAFYVAFTSRR